MKGIVMATFEDTLLYRAFTGRASKIAAGPTDLSDAFHRLRTLVQDTEKYIVLSFPEYTPHDHLRHLDGLFGLADRLLGEAVYNRLGNAELVLLVFGLYTHDWGMALPLAELQRLFSGDDSSNSDMLAGEPNAAQVYVREAVSAGVSERTAQSEYLRRTHAFRSGLRIRRYLESASRVFADAVAKIAEGHALDIRELRDQQRYPLAYSVLGESVNIAALAAYVRIIDLLDIGDDRTPYALWKFVSASDEISKIEWQKHRALSPVAIQDGSGIREVLISGSADDPAIFSALADLRSWVDIQFTDSMAFLKTMPVKYQLDLDSRINWNLQAVGFEPILVRFECDRSAVLGLLSDELYRSDPLAFIRELLQNSVDAIDARSALLAEIGLMLKGEIAIKIRSTGDFLKIEWSDNGIGMDVPVLSSYFATVGRSWYNSREAGRISALHPISKFGIGVLSLFAISDRISVTTRKDPRAGDVESGFVVEIPGRDKYFQICPMPDAPVGTVVTLSIRTASEVVSKESICSAVARISRLVKHRVTIDSDGVLIEAGAADTRSFQPLSLQAIRGESASALTAACRVIDFEIGIQSPHFKGHYSALIPRVPEEIQDPVGYQEWLIGETPVSFEDILTDSEQVVFAKGIQVGPVTPQRRREAGVYVGARHTEWIPPKIWLNVFDPKCMEFDLNRSVAHFTSESLTDALWAEISLSLRTEIFRGEANDPVTLAKFLGTCALFGAVPDAGLRTLVGCNDVPLLILQSVGGTGWQFMSEFIQGSEVFEAPFELAYVASEVSGRIQQNAFTGWEGANVLFPTEGFSGRNPPYLKHVLSFGEKMLTQSGWIPQALQFVRPPASDPVPLVCRVWRKGDADDLSSDKQTKSLPWNALRRVCKDLPQLLEFPEASKEIAAIGSRYWNVKHPKIVAISQSLLELSLRFNQRKLSTEKTRLFTYLTSNSFYGYTVPSRRAGFTLAIDLPNRLLDLAEGEEFACAHRLVVGDFYPGTTDKYLNPYHYDLRGWRKQGSDLGLAMQ